MHSPDEITIRACELPQDLGGLCRSFSSAFHRSYWPMLDEADDGFLEHVMPSFTAFSPEAFVATNAEGEVVGFLLGQTRFVMVGTIKGSAILFIWSLVALLMNRYGASRRARQFVVDVAMDMLPITAFGMPHSWPPCEVNVFAVHQHYQGRGIGKLLMDKFVGVAKSEGAQTISVVTDTTLSWQFYESYGFDLVHETPVRRAYRLSLPEESVTVKVFALQLS